MRIYLATSTSGVKKEQRKEMIKCCRPLYLLETFYSGEKCCAMVQNDVGTDVTALRTILQLKQAGKW